MRERLEQHSFVEVAAGWQNHSMFRKRLLLPLLVLIACERARTAPAPPQQPDRLADLRAPVDQLAKIYPRPASWMLGCYAAGAPLGTVIELTSEEAWSDEIVTRYRVRLVRENVLPERWTWAPAADGLVEVATGDGFMGWRFLLHRTEQGLGGEARAWDDVPDGRPRPVMPADFRRVRC
jgi:hypothetical protein